MKKQKNGYEVKILNDDKSKYPKKPKHGKKKRSI